MFLGGSTYRPELAIQDYSGFVNAANIKAESMARLSAKISGAAKDYQEKKEIKEANKLFDETLLGFAKQDTAVGESLRSMGLVDLGSISASRKGLGRKQMLEFINTLAESEINSQQNLLGVKDLDAFKAALPNDVKLTPEGKLVDTTFRNEILPFNDPRVQQMLLTEEGRYYLRGYTLPEYIEQTP